MQSPLLRPWDVEELQDKSAPRGAGVLVAWWICQGWRGQASRVTKIKARHRSRRTTSLWRTPLRYLMDGERRWEQPIKSINKIRKCWQEMMTGGREGQTSLRYFAISQTSGGVNMSTGGFLGRHLLCYSHRTCYTKAFHSTQGVFPSQISAFQSKRWINLWSRSVCPCWPSAASALFMTVRSQRTTCNRKKVHLTFATERTPYSVGRNDPGDIYSSERDVLHAAQSHQESFSLQGIIAGGL